MKLKFNDDGLVEGGIQCSMDRSGGVLSEIVFNLTEWIEKRFHELHYEAEQSHQAGRKFIAYHSLWIGEVQKPFAFVQARRSNFTAFCVHPELRNTERWMLESADPEKLSAFLANNARKVSSLEW
jgi:hypothetical protein